MVYANGWAQEHISFAAQPEVQLHPAKADGLRGHSGAEQQLFSDFQEEAENSGMKMMGEPQSLLACLFACFFGSRAVTSCPVQAGPFCLKICHSEEAFYYLTGKHICLESLLPGRSHYPLRGLLPVSY